MTTVRRTGRGCVYELARPYGYFSITVQHTHSASDVDPLNLMDMNISVEEEFRNRNLSRALMFDLLSNLDPRLMEATLYIDTDASAGFWAHAGLVPNPNCEADVPERGYEKCVRLRDLLLFSAA